MAHSDKKFSLLMVDDEPSVLSSLKRVFFKNEYQILTADNGESALDLLNKFKIDAALIDLKMPGMDGMALLKKMRRDYPQVMAIALGRSDCIEPEDLPPNIVARSTNGSGPIEPPADDSMAAYEKSAILNALKKSAHNRRIAAKILGVGEATLYRKIAKYGLSTAKVPGEENQL